MVRQNWQLSIQFGLYDKADSNLYYKVEDGNLVMLLLYVDDMFVTGMDGLIADRKRKCYHQICSNKFQFLAAFYLPAAEFQMNL